MARNDRVRLEIMFEGGASVSVDVDPATADELDRVLGAPDRDGGSFAFEAEDGRYVLALPKIVFVRRTEREQIVGFGASA